MGFMNKIGAEAITIRVHAHEFELPKREFGERLRHAALHRRASTPHRGVRYEKHGASGASTLITRVLAAMRVLALRKEP